MRDAGAIVVGSANMDEMGMGSFGLYGYEGKSVKNPIDEGHFAGGSSAGSAVIVKSYQALGALGTDTGGSVNYPAHCCGLFSMKPSFGRISRFGQILYSSSNETTGPFGHSINDVHAFFGKYDKIRQTAIYMICLLQISCKVLISMTPAVSTLLNWIRSVTSIALPTTNSIPQVSSKDFASAFSTSLTSRNLMTETVPFRS